MNPAVSNPIVVECTDASFTIRMKKFRSPERELKILDSVSCEFFGGTLIAILGPSGCGKTTLMTAIAGRLTHPGLKLQLSVNGVEIDPVKNRSNFACVPAHEFLFPTDTPVEAFNFVSTLTRPSLAAERRSEIVKKKLRELRLESAQDTYMGSATLKGVSSGEKKRSSVGMELIPLREVLFLDEPTTGLDSVTALELVQLLHNIAKQGVCVVAVIHQPSAQVWELFDNVMFMTKGKLVYHGPVDGVVEYFASRGYMCPSQYTPADYILFLLQTLGDGAVADLISEYRPAMQRTKDMIIQGRLAGGVHRVITPFKRAGAGVQFKELVKREYRSTTRDPVVVYLRIAIALVFGTLIGFLLFQVGKQPGGAANASHVGLVASLAIFAMTSSGQALLVAYAAERPIAIREYGSGFYSIFVYSVSKDVLEIPMVTIGVLIYLTLGYFLGALQGNFLLLLLGMWLTGVSAAVVSFFLASFIATLDMASQISALVLIVQVLLAGFFVSSEQVPAVLRWIQWIIPLKYGLSIMFIAEFSGTENSAPFFAAANLNPNMILFYIFMLIGITVVIRVLAAVGLWWTCRKATV